MSYFGEVIKVADSLAMAIAASIDFPDEQALGSAGTHIVYQGHKYLLVIQNGMYAAYDESVYGSDGSLLADATDVYINAAGEVVSQSASDIAGISKNLAWLALGAFVLYAMFATSRGEPPKAEAA
jgi:hypothetical protein